MDTLIRGMRSAGAMAARLLYPPVCAGCGGAIGAAPAVCSRCWRELSFIERPFCEVLGLPFRFDLGRGFLSAEAIAQPPEFARLRAALLYDGLAPRLVSRLKYGDRTDLLPLMAGWMARAGRELLADCDCVVPVPLHRSRLLWRRFNQASELGRFIARGRPQVFVPDALERRRATPQQVGLGREERRRNVAGAFAAGRRASAVVEKRVLLIDDVYTTGATIAAATKALKRIGAREVDVLVFARVAVGGA